jgi:spermidine/putrescine transport system ATP-binding protein
MSGLNVNVRDLIKIHHTGKIEVQALRGLNLEISAGELVAIIGPSGSGKSSLLNIIGGLDKATAGTVTVGDKIVTDLSVRQLVDFRRKMVGHIFQNLNLIPTLTAQENIEFSMVASGIKRDKRKERVQELLKIVGLETRAHHKPEELSGGEQQRVAIARALAVKPQVLLLDEPLGALDLKLRKEMQIELKKIQQHLGITFIYVTHDQEEALTMSDTIVVLHKGVIQQMGTPIDIYNEPQNAFVADFIGESNIIRGTMLKDKLVNFMDVDIPCVDSGYGENEEVDVVIRPEDIKIVSPEKGQLQGTVESVTFKGVHYEMIVKCEDKKTSTNFIIQSTDKAELGAEIGMKIAPDDIHIMEVPL